MAFIKVQKLVRNEDGSIRSCSASILVTEYDRSAKHFSRHRFREKLGKVLFLDSTGKKGYSSLLPEALWPMMLFLIPLNM